MKEDGIYVVGVIAVAVGTLLTAWALLALIVGITNAQNQMNWCQFKDGSYLKAEATGRRWSPNMLTIGLTGECINPGDKGL